MNLNPSSSMGDFYCIIQIPIILYDETDKDFTIAYLCGENLLSAILD